MVSFQRALTEGDVRVHPGEVDPTLGVFFDNPQGTRRMTVVRINKEGIVEAFAVVTPVEPYRGLPVHQVGYAVPPQFRGKGYAKAILEATIAELKEGMIRAGKKSFWVEAIVDATNLPSKGVAKAVLSKQGKPTKDDRSGTPAIQYLRKIA
jgi:GNAT superfamily N-acetyltransferase